MKKEKSSKRAKSSSRPSKRSGRGKKREGQPARVASAASPPLQFTRLNWILLAAAALVLIFGYLTLSSSSPVASTLVAPLLLVVGYGVLIPLGLIL